MATDLMAEKYRVDRRDAYALANLVVVRGVHAILRDDAIRI